MLNNITGIYHPCNSYIYLYGDMDVEERLDWMDRNYLSQFGPAEIDSSIEKQKSRPRSKSSARIQNEPIAKEFIAKIQAVDEPVNAKWMTYNVRYCTTSQKAVAIARIAEEWGAIEKVSIKNRTYYVPVKDWVMPE